MGRHEELFPVRPGPPLEKGRPETHCALFTPLRPRERGESRPLHREFRDRPPAHQTVCIGARQRSFTPRWTRTSSGRRAGPARGTTIWLSPRSSPTSESSWPSKPSAAWTARSGSPAADLCGDRFNEPPAGNIRFLGHVPDRELRKLYQNCRALIFPGMEDFGDGSGRSTSLREAGRVLRKRRRRPRVSSTEIPGVHFQSQEPEALIQAVEKLEQQPLGRSSHS